MEHLQANYPGLDQIVLKQHSSNNNVYFDIEGKEHHTWITKANDDTHNPNIQTELPGKTKPYQF